MTRARVFYVWMVLAVALAFALSWLLALARVPQIEAGYLLFAFGLAFAWVSPALIRAIYRRLW